MTKQLLWIVWSGGIETRDDGWVIYHNVGFSMLKHPNGALTKHRTPQEAKRATIENQGGRR